MRMSVNGILKDFVNNGDLFLTETKLLLLDKQIYEAIR
jgi:hypothetical protein